MKQYKTWQLMLIGIVGWALILFAFLLMIAFATHPMGTR